MVLAWTACAFGTASFAQPAAQPPADDDAVVSVASPLGSLDYRAGRGLRVGDTGLTLGGFATLEIDREEGEPGEIALDGLNFLIHYEPIESLRLFSELEVGPLVEVETDDFDPHSDPEFVVERLHADWSASDAFQLRVGKFQTPFGRWNLVPAEPFVWTPEEPLTVANGFDEHQTGVALLGSLFVASHTLDYWLYGQVAGAFDPPRDESPADHSVGGRLAYSGASGDWSFGASFLASEEDGDWSELGGLDAVLRSGALELTAELVLQRGDIPGRDLWGAHLQGVYDLEPCIPLLHGVFAVGRYEHFDLEGSRSANVFDLGFTWIPVDWLNLKLGYRLADRETAEVRRGLVTSVSVLF